MCVRSIEFSSMIVTKVFGGVWWRPKDKIFGRSTKSCNVERCRPLGWCNAKKRVRRANYPSQSIAQ